MPSRRHVHTRSIRVDAYARDDGLWDLDLENPPLIITVEQVGELIATLRDSLDALASELKLPSGVKSGAAA